MSAHVTIDQADPNRLRIELRQRAGEVIRFAVFVFVILAAWYSLSPAARAEPWPLLLILGLTIFWSMIASTAREVYVVDPVAGTIDVVFSSLVRTHGQHLSARDVVAVGVATGGPDDNRRLVELIGDDGTVRLRLPRRITTLSVTNQSDIAHVLAGQLAVPVRAERTV